VRQRLETTPKYTIYGSPWGYGYGWGYPGFYGYDWNPWYTTVEIKDITVGTLTVDLQDVASGQLVWRGISAKRVHRCRSRRMSKNGSTAGSRRCSRSIPPLRKTPS
jgi:hypothetical protein